jgi:hypothetical protein
MVKVVFESIVIPLRFFETAKLLSLPDHYILLQAKNKRFQICIYKKTFNYAVQNSLQGWTGLHITHWKQTAV